MPHNLAVASPSGILPKMNFTKYAETRQYPVLAQDGYMDATLERSLITDGVNTPVSLRTWSVSALLTPAVLSSLRTLWDSNTCIKPFYWYAPADASGRIGTNYDPTGVSTDGRFVAVFNSPVWEQTSGMARTAVSFELKLVA